MLRRPKSAEGPDYLRWAEAARKHLHPVDDYDGHTLPILAGRPGSIDIDDVERMAATTARRLDQWESLGTELAAAPGKKGDPAHRDIVKQPMRPGTVLAIVVLLTILLVAGIVFVIQLLSVS